MFKVQFCGNIAHKCLISPVFTSRTHLTNNLKQIRLLSNKSLPEKSNERSHRTGLTNSFNETNPFPRNHSIDPWESRIEPTSSETEQEFLVRVKQDPDMFGDGLSKPEVVDEGDIVEEKYFTEQPSHYKRLSTKQYADIIKGFIRQRKIKEAIDVVEVRMLKEDRIKPENYIYNLLLGACGRVGYTKKAFMLYNDMKKRGLKVTPGTYTALFNACANSPWPSTDGLNRVKHLHQIMIEKGDEPNDTNYNAMIKAFGRCGDLHTAFTLVDEMSHKGFPIKDDTINVLLQTCITDKEVGFRHTLLVWRKLIEKNIRPNVFTFNLMLRCVRDCGLGDLETTRNVINKLVGGDVHFAALPESSRLRLEEGDKQKNSDSDKVDFLEAHLDTKEAEDGSNSQNISESNSESTSDYLTETSSVKPIASNELRPNLLADKPHLGSILSLSEVKRPEDRLLLLGGCKGLLETMCRHKCTPNVKTFTLLLNCIPSTLPSEKELLIAMKKMNVEADIDFYNMLIKKKSMRCDYEGAREILVSMKQKKLRPDLITYGVLSLGCKTKAEAIDLIDKMKAAGYILNAAILGAMLKQACFHLQFDYIFEIMELCLKESIPVNKMFIGHLQTFKAKLKAKMEEKELNKKEVKLFCVFKARYKTWLTEVQIDDSEDAHPWQQYRQTYPENVTFKPKDTARYKPRHASLFKVKTSTKHRYKNF